MKTITKKNVSRKRVSANLLIDNLRVGDRVTIRIPNGIGINGVEWKNVSGKAVIISEGFATLNMGGKHGSVAVASAENIVSVGNKYASTH